MNFTAVLRTITAPLYEAVDVKTFESEPIHSMMRETPLGVGSVGDKKPLSANPRALSNIARSKVGSDVVVLSK